MLTTASQFTPRARSLQTQHAVATRVIAVSSAAGTRQPHQSRGFRLGMWFSHVDPELHREIRRRRRVLKHKYAEQINRQLSWDKHSFAEDARHTLRCVMNGYWMSHNARPGGRYVDEFRADKKQPSAKEESVRPGQNIEDVERGAMDHLLFGKNQEQNASNTHSRSKQRVRNTNSVFVPHKSYGSLERDDFVIDPITNRKVAKHPAPNTPKDGVNIPVKTFRDKEAVRFDDLKPPYEDLDKYRSVVVDEITSRFVEDGEPRYSDLHKYKPFFADVASEKNRQSRYDDLSKYKAFKHNEPDGKRDPTVEELSKNYDPEELQKYGPMKWNEPDGNPGPSTDPRVAEGLTKDYDPDELAKYGPVKWNEPDGNPTPSTDPRVAEGLTKDYDPEELAQYNKPVYWNEPNGQPLPSQDKRVAEGLTKDYPDLQSYNRAYRWNEPDGKPTTSDDSRMAEELTKDYADLHMYSRAYKWNEPDGKPAPTVEEQSKHYTDLAGYESARDYKDIGTVGKPAPTAEVFTKTYADMDRSGPVIHRKPDGRSAIQADSVQQSQKNTDAQSGNADNVEKSNYRKMLDSLMEQHQAASDAIDREASLAVKSAKAKAEQEDMTNLSETKMTGNYIRDFPEDFNGSWTETLHNADVQAEDQRMDGGLEGAFGQPSHKLQPALDRVSSSKPPVTKSIREPGHSDLHSKEAQTVEPSSDEDCSDNSEANAKPDSTDESARYKVLAYDPAMHEINIAQISFVPEAASALTPADALARLSDPARFFPHFAALEAEGYEIVSGTGNVLIFRKGRSSPTKQAEEAPSEPQLASTMATESEASEMPINPIDMTGRAKMSPASANFASPTGYVNYEDLPENEASNLPPPPPRIKYNIDVQREEPVYSGYKTRNYDDHKKKSLGKRLVVGGVWVASISYALGVVSEYFTTGGMDGLGPKGL
ncbi:hypothetical protein VP1G_01061 [Cytospora mali]|uniref:Uncharacterized protein n=1 Tax=Cytospora mali TaxID=578113 RepID=A0A194UQG2_CYTMA|nr:hypothetical protein VP1G_01061 [Valsa mali var. pyri (nom. inval.)]